MGSSDRVLSYFLTFAIGVMFFLSLTLLFFYEGGFVDLGGYLQLMPDRLGLLLSTYILLVSLVVHRYSINYMADDPGYKRYFLLLFLMSLSLVTLVVAGNLLLIATCWNLMGVILYLFLVHNYRRREARRWANWALATHLLSDAVLAVAIWMIYRETGSLFLGDVFEAIRGSGGGWVGVASLLLMISAITKSAQFPFHLWLVYSMEGPTPVSALMHAGIVNAGAFLINRFAPFFAEEGIALQVAFFVGSITAVFGSALMLVQNDVKRTLGYSTVGQMGYMIMELGVGAFSLAIYHMMTHGVFKATLFLISGNVIHNARKDPNIPRREIYDAVLGRLREERTVPVSVLMAITVTVPLLIVLLSHAVVEEDIVRKETAYILLFFGWITGVQVLISAFKLGRERPLHTLILVIGSMVVFMLGYVFLGHGLQSLLYTEEFAHRLYERAFGSVWFFAGELVFMGALVFAGWVFLWLSGRRVDVPLWSRLYSHMAEDFHMVSLYNRVGHLSGAIVSFARMDHGRIPLYAGAVLLLLLIFFYDPGLAVASLFMPLFPLSLLIIEIMKRTGYVAYPLFVAGAILSSLAVGKPPEFMHVIASVTFLLHGLRMSASRGLRDLSHEVYAGVMAIGWILSGGEPVAMLWLGTIPLMLGWSSYAVRSRFGSCSTRLLSGVWDHSPMLALSLVLIALFITGTAPLPSFLFKLELLTGESLLLFVIVLAGWVALSLGVLPGVVRMLSGPRVEHLLYRDLSLRETAMAVIFFLLSALWGLLHLRGLI